MADDLYALMSRGTPNPPEPLSVIDMDADKCCRRELPKLILTGDPATWKTGDKLACPRCGTEFTSEMIGPNRYWRIVPAFAIVRRR